ncbi:MAG TPA: methyltransferase domain-containing protein [Candidatus Dormibacteraeota bacterium]
MDARPQSDPIEVSVEHTIDFFDEFAPAYEEWASGLHRKVAARVVEVAAPKRGEAALDVGTGTGLVARGVAAKVGNKGSVIGIDVSPGMLSLAHELSAGVTNLTFLLQPAEVLVFKDGSFDLVTLSEVLTFLLDPPHALSEIRRVLRPAGRLVLSLHRRSLGTEAQDAFFVVLDRFARRHFLNVPRLPAERAAWGEPSILPEILGAAGLELASTTQLVTGGRARSPREWTSLMAGSGPLPHTLISVLGPRLRAEFEGELDLEMAQLGDDAWRYHHAFTVAEARPSL